MQLSYVQLRENNDEYSKNDDNGSSNSRSPVYSFFINFLLLLLFHCRWFTFRCAHVTQPFYRILISIGLL